VQVRLLGPIDVTVDGAVRPVAGLRRKAVLAVLGLSAGEIVHADRLIDVVWGDKPPPTASNTLQAHVSYLRGVLGARTAIVARAPGYVLDTGVDATDLQLAERLVRQGKDADDAAQRAADLRAAVALWRGQPLAELSGHPWLDEQTERLANLHFETVLALIDARLALGEHAQLVPELDRLTLEHPFHEPLHGQLMVALYGAGRQAEALTAYQQLRRSLDEELGIEPSPALRELEAAILRQDDTLLPQPSPVRATGSATNSAIPAQLPSPVDGFVGRDAQLAQLDAFLAGVNTASAQRGGAPTLIIAAIGGTAGVGKTSLAVHWGQRVRHQFPDGQLHLDLRGYSTSPPVQPGQALAQFLHALGVPAERVPPDVDEAAAMYRTLVADRRMLIVLDNAASPDQVRPLLPGSPRCLVVVTSRDRLGGLIVSEGARLLALDVLPPEGAHALLETIIGAGRTAAEPDAVAALAQACGYLPLALRIAAANLAMRPQSSIAGYAAELREGNRLAALRVDGDEQSAVRAAFDLSYATLKPDERCVFRRLALMPGPDADVAVAATLADVERTQARRILGRLVDRHLVRETAIGRFALHDLLRLYARSLADGEDGATVVDAALDRLYAHYVGATEATANLLYRETIRLPAAAGNAPAASPFGDHIEALAWLDAERANLVALVHAAAEHGPRPAGWRLADNLRGYFYLRRPAADWLSVGTNALRAAEGHPAPQASAHLSLGVAYNTQGNRDLAIDHFTSALALTQVSGWLEGQAAALNNLGTVHSQTGHHRAAADWFAKAVRVHERAGRPLGQAIAVDNMGIVHRELGEPEAAADLHRQAIALHKATEFPFGHATAQMNLGAAYFDLGRLDESEAQYVEAHALHRQTGNRDREAICLYGLAEVHCAAGRHEQALELARDALAVARDIADRRTEANAAITLGTIYGRLDRHRPALEHHRHALQLARQTDSRYIRARALVAVAGAELALGQVTDAHATVQEALALTERDGYQRLAAEARALAAVLHPPLQLPVPTESSAAYAFRPQPHAFSRRNAERAAL
jgi:DNA-binding SARP family transcriptional activator/tetratricopeptide (TPR) repeat protein